jgi:group II intron reverse transcriptase/maturase
MSVKPETRKCPLVEPLMPLQNDLLERIVHALKSAWQKLLRSDGSIKESLGTPANGTGQGRKKSPGVDMKSTVEAHREHRADPEKIARELRTGYVPSPIKRVSIPKASGGQRQIGIPTVRDRAVQTAMLMVMGPQIDKGFSEASHGFRYGRNTFTAARQALAYIKGGAKYAVKIDFCKCFDEIDHIILMRMIRTIIPDGMVSQLIEDFVKAEVMLKDGTRLKSNAGVHQGSPMGPFLTNVYLHVLDMELARRNLKHVRYADDVIVLTDSKKAADRVLRSISNFASKELNLRVNQEKSKTMPVHELEFLGFAFNNGIMIGRENREKFEGTIKWMTRSQKQKDAEENLERFKLWLTRWLSHFGWTDDQAQVIAINAWVLELLRQREKDGYLLVDAFRQSWEQSIRRHGSWKRALAAHDQSTRQK